MVLQGTYALSSQLDEDHSLAGNDGPATTSIVQQPAFHSVKGCLDTAGDDLTAIKARQGGQNIGSCSSEMSRVVCFAKALTTGPASHQ